MPILDRALAESSDCGDCRAELAFCGQIAGDRLHMKTLMLACSIVGLFGQAGGAHDGLNGNWTSLEVVRPQP